MKKSHRTLFAVIFVVWRKVRLSGPEDIESDNVKVSWSMICLEQQRNGAMQLPAWCYTNIIKKDAIVSDFFFFNLQTERTLLVIQLIGAERKTSLAVSLFTCNCTYKTQ